MGLSITCYHRKKIICPKCGEIVGYTDLDEILFGGRAWYPLLEKLGYYVPYDQRTENNDWYGKDMILSTEQVEYAFMFAKENPDAYGAYSLAQLIMKVLREDNLLVVTADW